MSFIALHMCITRYSLDQELIYTVGMIELHRKKQWCYCCVMAVSIGSARRGENITYILLQLLCQPREGLCYISLCYGCCVSQERINVSSVLMALNSPSSLLILTLPTTDSTNSVNSEAIGVKNSISNTNNIQFVGPNRVMW